MKPLTVLPESIPREMRIYNRWLLWCLVSRDSKYTKVPYQLNGNCASVSDPSSWGSFNKIIDCYRAGGFDGIGFVLGQGIGGVDFDGDVNEDPLKFRRIPSGVLRSQTGCITFSSTTERPRGVVRSGHGKSTSKTGTSLSQAIKSARLRALWTLPLRRFTTYTST